MSSHASYKYAIHACYRESHHQECVLMSSRAAMYSASMSSCVIGWGVSLGSRHPNSMYVNHVCHSRLSSNKVNIKHSPNITICLVIIMYAIHVCHSRFSPRSSSLSCVSFLLLVANQGCGYVGILWLC